jgi:iron complex outermembrane receptor protein
MRKRIHIGTEGFARLTQAIVAILSICLGTMAYAAQDEDVIEEVIVTGSYIKSSPADSASPLSVITAADIQNNHSVDMNELLTRIPYQSGGYVQAATFTGGGFQGRLPINLRNLGDAATLPLVNGRRHLPAFVSPLGDSTVDINSMIPQIMIDRIEIVKDGSSALYGSYAVAGVVNFITN